MVQPDPRWLEILRASGWQTVALTLASGAFLLFDRIGWIPALDPWMVQLTWLMLLICGCLALASMGSAVARFFQLGRWIMHWVNRHLERRAAQNYILHMTKKEREIIGYLLHHNQKMFQSDAGGGYAAPLLSRGIVAVMRGPGQAFDPSDVTIGIPDHIWNVLVKRKDAFPYKPPKTGGGPDPWRIPWNPADTPLDVRRPRSPCSGHEPASPAA